MTLQTRFRAYNPDGATLGLLDAPPSWDVSLPVNQVSAANFEYPIAAKRSDWLADACEIALEIHNGTAWVEPANARYLRMVQSNDPTNGAADVVKYSMPGYAFNLEGIVVVPYAPGGAEVNYDDEGKRKFLAATPGRILKSILDEARTIDPEIRGGFSLGFTPTVDSAGVAWAKQLTIYYEPGMSLLTVLENLSSQGIVDWVMEGRELKVYNVDTALAVRRDSVVVRGAEEEAPTKSTLEGLRHIVMLRGDEGAVWLQENANADTPWGKSMTVLNQGGIRDEGTALSLIGAELKTGSKERIQYTRSISLDAAKKVPLVDYLPGDYIKAPGKTAKLESFRVFQITLRSSRSATLTLNDRFEDSLIRMAKRQKGIVNGASGDAGTGSQPTAPNVGKRKPVAPQGLVVSSAAYIDNAGNPQAVANTTFDAQEIGTDGLPLTLRGVELWGWKTADDLPKLLTIGDADGSIAFSPLPIDEDWSFRVRSVGTNGIASSFSSTVGVKLSKDLTPPPKPSALEAEARSGVVTLTWDGKAYNGTEMPVDFERADVVQGPLPGKVIGNIGIGEGERAFHVTNLPYNISNDWWLVAVDTSQNKSEPSDSVSAVTTPLVDTDIIGRIIDGVNVKLGTVTSELIADAAILGGKLADNAVSLAKLDSITREMIEDAGADATSANGRVTTSQNAPIPENGAGKPNGALWFRYDAAGILIGTWLWNGTSWDSQAWGSAAIGDGAITQTKLDSVINNAINTAKSDAETALASANGKNRIVYSTSVASGTDDGSGYNFINGDTWFQSIGGIIIGQWQFGSGSWGPRALDNAMVANLDAGKITSGFIAAARIDANTITAEKLVLGSFANLIPNGSFERGAAGWLSVEEVEFTTTNNGPGGAVSTIARVTPVVADAGFTSSAYPFNAAGAPYTPGASYAFRLVVRKVSGTAGSIRIRLGFHGTDQSNFWVVVPGTELTASSSGTGWQVLEGTYKTSVAPQELTRDRMSVSIHTSGAVGSVFEIAEMTMRQMASAELIVDGSVTAQKMVTGTITAASGIIADAAIGSAQIMNAAITNAKIASLDAGKITSGFIDAARIAANTITASKIAIGDFTNYAAGSGFENDLHPWTLTNGAASRYASVTRAHSGSYSLFIDGSGPSGIAARLNTTIDAAEGDQWYIEFWASRNSTWNGSASNSKLRIGDQNNSIITAVPYDVSSMPANGAPQKFTHDFVVPAGKTGLIFILYSDATAGGVWIDDIVIRRRVTGELLVDGAVTARSIATGTITANEIAGRTITAAKIATNAITANEIAALTITAAEIASLAITSAKIAALAIQAGHIAANAITADKIEAGAITAIKIDTDAITATKIAATAITSKHTITGAKFQTTSTANRGIEITTAGLNAYDASGNVTVNINATNGAATFTGTIKNRFSGPRVQINSSSTQATIFFYGNSEGGNILPAQIASDPDGQSLFLFGGNPNSTTPIYTTLRLNERTSPVSWILGRQGYDGAAAYPRIRGDESTVSFWERSTGHRITLDPNGFTYIVGNGLAIQGQLTTTGAKQFQMDHPVKEGKTLTHASTESPHNGVEYWSDGMVEMPAQGFKTVTLPPYFEALTAPDHRVAILTPGSPKADLWAGPIEDGKLVVYGAPGALFSWVVKARRIKLDEDGRDTLHFNVEQDKVEAADPETLIPVAP